MSRAVRARLPHKLRSQHARRRVVQPVERNAEHDVSPPPRAANGRRIRRRARLRDNQRVPVFVRVRRSIVSFTGGRDRHLGLVRREWEHAPSCLFFRVGNIICLHSVKKYQSQYVQPK